MLFVKIELLYYDLFKNQTVMYIKQKHFTSIRKKYFDSFESHGFLFSSLVI